MGVFYWQMNKSHLTAIKRNKLSAPMRYLRGVFSTGKYLDYGSGRGYDAEALGLFQFDPHYFNVEYSDNTFDIITCNYVLNVCLPSQQNEVIAKIHSLLNQSGVAYITVRRDVKKEGFTKKGTYQRNVVLDLPIEFEKKNQFCIYKLTK